MPRRDDIHNILVIGAGPIVIGQAAEFDYSGTQAIRALKREGYRVVLVNSNPATIMTDPELADATYIEPITFDVLKLIIEKEKPDAILPTVGGQTALNAALELYESGLLDEHNIILLGADARSVELAENRQLFQETMVNAGLDVPTGGMASSLAEAQEIAATIGRYPILIRPSFTLGGSGGSIAYDAQDLIEKVSFGLRESPSHSVLVEESVLGWKEFEVEVMRDAADNFVIVCSIENIDPMGIHTGDSVTVAPAMTLTDREYQRLRDQARVVMNAVGVETGGSNVQFAVNPEDGRVLVIEMNPRVSRSSALASKATGFPIAKIAALVAVGYRLDEITNDVTQTTVASFEPSIDYVVTKLPRWAFEKFPGVDPELGPQMKSVGEAMSIGRTFRESFMKGLQSLELSRPPFPTETHRVWDGSLESLKAGRAERYYAIWEALQDGCTVEDIAAHTYIDPWFLSQFALIVGLENDIQQYRSVADIPAHLFRRAKRDGFSDEHLAYLTSTTQKAVREQRKNTQLLPTYHVVDTCAAEFESHTPYMYSSYETETEITASEKQKVIILGGGPNRIGQGIEFDYCCVHAIQAVQANGYEAIMINCNPETVSTDYDISDRLYFEPLSIEHVLNVVENEQPLHGVIIQFGGQTPLNLAHELQTANVPILGTPPDAIDLAEDRGRFGTLLQELDIPAPAFGIAHSIEEATTIANKINYPVVVRPSYVLGGRSMAIVYRQAQLHQYVEAAMSNNAHQAILIDQYLEDAFEIDVDAVCDGERVVIGGMMQHIEEAGVHSGDSACVMPPYKISAYHAAIMQEYTERLGLAMGVKGLMNIQFAIKDDIVYVLEVNPRASRTVPYVSKATGVPLSRIATHVMLGQSLASQGLIESPPIDGFFVKEAVLPFKKFLGVDALLGPEMRSTGEVMGHAARFGHAFAKAQLAAGDRLPTAGTVLVSLNDFDKSAGLKIARDLSRLGFQIVATRGTAAFFVQAGLTVSPINKVSEGSPHILEAIANDNIDLIINTPLGESAFDDGSYIRMAAVRYGVPLLTTLSAAQAAVNGIRTLQNHDLRVRSLQEHYRYNKK